MVGWLTHGMDLSRSSLIGKQQISYGSELSCALSTRGSRSICHLRCPVTTISELLTGFRQSKEILLAPDIDEELTSWLLIMQRNTLWNFYSCLLGWFVRLVNALKYMLPHVGNRVTSFSFLIAFQSVTEDRAEPKAAGSQGRWSEHTGQSWRHLVRKQQHYNFGVPSLIHVIGKQIQEVSGFFLSFILLIFLTLIISSNGVLSSQCSRYRSYSVCLWSKTKVQLSPFCPSVISNVHVTHFPAWSSLS